MSDELPGKPEVLWHGVRRVELLNCGHGDNRPGVSVMLDDVPGIKEGGDVYVIVARFTKGDRP